MEERNKKGMWRNVSKQKKNIMLQIIDNGRRGKEKQK